MDELDLLKKNLPAHPGILGKEKYFNSSVLVPFVRIDGEYHLLFQKRAAHIRQGGEICFPGGEFDPERDSGLKSTALRETTEELGIAPSDIRIIGRMDTIIAPMGATIDSFVGILNRNVLSSIKIAPKEVASVFTLPLSRFSMDYVERFQVRLEVQPSYRDKNGREITLLPGKELGLPEKYHGPWEGKNHRVLVYKTDRGVVWGITAEIIHDIVKKFQGKPDDKLR